MRTFRFKLTAQRNLETLESNATTFGQLKEDIKNSHLSNTIVFDRVTTMRDGKEWVSRIKLIDKLTSTEYMDMDEAHLPQGDVITFFVLPFEHKGGIIDSVAELLETMEDDEEGFYDTIEEYGYNELRSLGSNLNSMYNAEISLSGKREDIARNIATWAVGFYDSLNSFESIDDTSENSTIQEVVSLLLTAIEKIQSLSLENYVDTETLDDLHERALELQRRINS